MFEDDVWLIELAVPLHDNGRIAIQTRPSKPRRRRKKRPAMMCRRSIGDALFSRSNDASSNWAR